MRNQDQEPLGAIRGWIVRLAGVAAGSGVAAAGYVGLVTGAIAPDLGLGRRSRPLGPHAVDIAAPREVVFDARGSAIIPADAGLGYAYVPSKRGTRLSGDPRDIALRTAPYGALSPSSGTAGRRVA